MRWGDRKVELRSAAKLRREISSELERLIPAHGELTSTINARKAEQLEVSAALMKGAPPRPDFSAIDREIGQAIADGDGERQAQLEQERNEQLDGWEAAFSEHVAREPGLRQRAANSVAEIEELERRRQPITDKLVFLAEQVLSDLAGPLVERYGEAAFECARARAELVGVYFVAHQISCHESLWKPIVFEVELPPSVPGVLPSAPTSDGPAGRADQLLARLRECGLLGAMQHKPRSGANAEHEARGQVADSV